MRVNAAPLFLRGIRDRFWPTYQAGEKQVDSRLGKVMDLAVPSDKASEVYGYAQAAPVARLWTEGQGIPSDAFGAVNFSVRNWKWGVGVPIPRTHVEDDQTHKIMSRVYESASSMAMLPERLFYWALNGGGTLDAIQLQPSVPNAPDGASWFSATDGSGAARFGRTGGNIQTSHGVASSAAIQTDLFGGLSAMAAFVNQQNQPYWNPSDIQKEVMIFFNSSNLLNFVSALQQLFNVSSSGSAAPSNVVLDAALKVTPVPSPRLTTNNWAIAAVNAPFKAPFFQEREPTTEALAEAGNSDMAREFDQFKYYVRRRGAFALALPIGWVGVQ